MARKATDSVELENLVRASAAEHLKEILPYRELKGTYQKIGERLNLLFRLSAHPEGDPYLVYSVETLNPEKSKERLAFSNWEIVTVKSADVSLYRPGKGSPDRIRELGEFLRYFEELYPDPQANTHYYFLLEPEDPLYSTLREEVIASCIPMDEEIFLQIRRASDLIQEAIKAYEDPGVRSYFVHLLIWSKFLLYYAQKSSDRKVVFDYDEDFFPFMNVKKNLSDLIRSLEESLRTHSRSPYFPYMFPKYIILTDAPMGLKIFVSREKSIQPHEKHHAFPLPNGTYLLMSRETTSYIAPGLNFSLRRKR